jgi:hypothetical protein
MPILVNCTCVCYPEKHQISFTKMIKFDEDHVDSDGNIEGVDVNICDYHCQVCEEDHEIKISTIRFVTSHQTSWEIVDVDVDDSDVDDICETGQEILKHCKNNSEFSVDTDSHRNCYCKTQNVCGCGCDPLHNGW